MEATKPTRPLLVSGRTLSLRLGVSQALIRRLTERGTLPHVRDGRRTLYDVEQARAALLRRAEQVAADGKEASRGE